MGIWRYALGTAWALVVGAIPALSQTAPLPLVTPLPGNTVTCVYDYLSIEDREIALLLIAREIADKGAFAKTSKNVQAVDRLIEDAHRKCLARFNWSIARSDTATGFALTSILAEATGQALESFGHPPAMIADYFRDNRPALAGRHVLSLTDRERFGTYLRDKGWTDPEQAELALATLYLETLMLRDKAMRRFAVAGGTGAQPIRRPPAVRRPAPAAKAARGKP